MSTSTGASGDVVARRAPGLDLYAPARARRRLEVSPRRARALARLGIETVQDLLEHYPRYHVDRTQLRTVRELGALAAQGHEGEVQVHARVASIDRPRRTRTGRVLIRGRIGDETGSVEVNWFNQEWVARALRPGSWAFFYGRLGVFRGRLQMTAPRFELVRTGREPFNVGRIVPIYPATAEVSSDQLRRHMWETLATAGPIADPLPDDLRGRLRRSTPSAHRQAVLAEAASGQVDVLIGTHALIQEAVSFARLGLVVVDEQHRFGVHQRKSLRAKGQEGEPDVLVMTATPIPRTLAVTIYGDLDLSILDELPGGRDPIETRLARGDEGRAAAYDLIRSEVAAGRQAFVVYALRDESGAVELRNAVSEARRLAEEVFPDLAVGLVHGDLSSDDKEAAMKAFREGRSQVLVATTVVEVGIDVPNATVMLVEDAERFGLAQLHQLRGRVGRGSHPSYCILQTDLDLGAPDPAAGAAAERLEALAKTRDGFELALVDLGQRGEGELFGARQSGMPQLKMARVLAHQEVVQRARELAIDMLERDPDLGAYEHAALRREMRNRFPERALDVVHWG